MLISKLACTGKEKDLKDCGGILHIYFRIKESKM